MRKYLLLLSGLLIVSMTIYASNHVSIEPKVPPTSIKIMALEKIAGLSMKEVRKIMGRKLTLKEKLGVKVLQWKIKKSLRKNASPRSYSKKTDLAFFFGIMSLLTLLIPMVGLLISPFCAIMALVLGYQERRRDPDNRKARTAIILGWIGLAAFFIVTAIVLSVLTQRSDCCF